MIKYGSVCSGIEAASVAWEPLGWKAQWFSEISPFQCAVLQHHFPAVPNRGCLIKLSEEIEDEPGTVDLVIGGTPCQDFSSAGTRGGLDGINSRLALSFVRLLARIRPRWIVWENVLGCLSSNKGADFRRFNEELEAIGYSTCWRVLDAQFFGVPQSRNRVFVVGYLGDWRPPAAVFCEANAYGSRQVGREKRGNLIYGTSDTGRFKFFANQSDCMPSDGQSLVTVDGGITWRRYTSTEKERLMGFPDGWTDIVYKGKSGPDEWRGFRAEALGNSMAVPVMQWLGERIDAVERILNASAAHKNP